MWLCPGSQWCSLMLTFLKPSACSSPFCQVYYCRGFWRLLEEGGGTRWKGYRSLNNFAKYSHPVPAPTTPLTLSSHSVSRNLLSVLSLHDNFPRELGLNAINWGGFKPTKMFHLLLLRLFVAVLSVRSLRNDHSFLFLMPRGFSITWLVDIVSQSLCSHVIFLLLWESVQIFFNPGSPNARWQYLNLVIPSEMLFPNKETKNWDHQASPLKVHNSTCDGLWNWLVWYSTWCYLITGTYLTLIPTSPITSIRKYYLDMPTFNPFTQWRTSWLFSILAIMN